MSVKFYDHNAELYHAAMYSMEQEMYGEYGDELYHYGRKGMRRGMHLPDVLDPTRELIGKVAPVANVYAKRLQRYGTGVYNSARRSLAEAGKSARRLARAGVKSARRAFRKSDAYDAYTDARAFARGIKRRFDENVTEPIKNEIAKEKWKESEAKKKKAAKAAKKKFKQGNYQAQENRRSEAAQDKIASLKKKASNAKTPEEARKYRDQAYELQKSEKSRKERERIRQGIQYESAHDSQREEAMSKFAEQQKKRAAKARRNAEDAKLANDPRYAQQKTNEAASRKAGEAGLARADAKQQKRSAQIREEEERKRREQVLSQERQRSSIQRMGENYVHAKDNPRKTIKSPYTINYTNDYRNSRESDNRERADERRKRAEAISRRQRSKGVRRR